VAEEIPQADLTNTQAEEQTPEDRADQELTPRSGVSVVCGKTRTCYELEKIPVAVGLSRVLVFHDHMTTL